MNHPEKRFLSAESFGQFVRLSPGYIGRVVSVHRHAINIACSLGDGAQTCRADHIMVILAGHPGRVPNGVHMRSEYQIDFDSSGVRAGQAVAQIENELWIADRLCIDLTLASPWDGSITSMESLDRANLASHESRLTGHFAAHSGVERRLTQFGYALVSASETSNRSRLEESVLSILGLGPGATPTGDDVLLGALAILDAAGPSNQSNLREVVDQTITAMPLATTGVSLALLRAAVVGQHAELTGNLVKAVFGSDEIALDRAIIEIKSVGATSGRDTVRGVHLGVQSLLAQSLRAFDVERSIAS